MVEDEPMFNSAQKLQARFDSDNDSFSVSLHSGYIRNQLNLRNGCTSIYINNQTDRNQVHPADGRGKLFGNSGTRQLRHTAFVCVSDPAKSFQNFRF